MLRPWFAEIIVRSHGKGNMSLRIARAVIGEIQRGRLGAGDPLPGSRELAVQLKVNRKTVVIAYEELVAQGWAYTDPRRGTFVAKALTASRSSGTTAGAPVRPFRLLEKPAPDGPPLWPPRGRVRFDDGLPDQRQVRAAPIARAYATAARSVARRGLFHYSDPRGTEELRVSISSMLNFERGLNTTPEHICITRGSQMALYLVAQAFVTRGDVVVFEALTYPPAVQAFCLAGAQPALARLNDDGIDLDHLEHLCRQKKVRALYLTPHHQFPTTVTLRPSGRLRLRALAQQFGFIIIEDDYDHEFHFSHQPLFPLASSDPLGQIVYVGSLSKVLSPSLRIGYIAAASDVVARLANCIGVIDRQGDPVAELAVVELIESGELRRHVRRTQDIYLRRRDAFATMARAMEDVVSFEVPSGGLAFWLSLHCPSEPALLKRVLDEHSVQCLLGSDCTLGAPQVAGLRLGYASATETEMERSLGVLHQALRQASRVVS